MLFASKVSSRGKGEVTVGIGKARSFVRSIHAKAQTNVEIKRKEREKSGSRDSSSNLSWLGFEAGRAFSTPRSLNNR